MNLIKRFRRDKAFFVDYKGFMSDILDKRHARRVPHDQLHRNEGRVWYPTTIMIPRLFTQHWDTASSRPYEYFAGGQTEIPSQTSGINGGYRMYVLLSQGSRTQCWLPALLVVALQWHWATTGRVQDGSPSIWCSLLTQLCEMHPQRNCWWQWGWFQWGRPEYYP